MAPNDHPTVGFLHPGKMGASLAALVKNGLWAGEGRSAATRDRAQAAGLRDVGTIPSLVERAEVMVSICPPDAARAVADQIAGLGFDGIYVDANAIAPATAREIGTGFSSFVDGGVIGPPATAAGTTRLYLSGPAAADVATLWNDTLLDARVVEGGPGAASALKMTFAAWTKGTAALLLNIHALAEAEGVNTALRDEWSISIPEMEQRTAGARRGAVVKAWRFAGEMEEIAASFSAHGLPSGFHQAASEVYGRLATFKDAEPAPELDVVVERLRTDDVTA